MKTTLEQDLRAYKAEVPEPRILQATGFFGRLLTFIDPVGLFELLSDPNPDTLFVGPSIKSYWLGPQCYDIYELLMYMEGHDTELARVDAIDLEPTAFNRLGKNTSVSSCIWNVGINNRTFQRGWQLAIDYTTPEHATPAELGVEYHRMTISSELQMKAQSVNGTIGDIVTAQLPENAYDLVICRNVLWQLPEAGQRAALHNIAQSMRDKALLVIGAGVGMGPHIRQPDVRPELTPYLEEVLDLRYLPDTGDQILQKGRKNFKLLWTSE